VFGVEARRRESDGAAIMERWCVLKDAFFSRLLAPCLYRLYRSHWHDTFRLIM
jgi:hypothetical protein